VEVGQLKIRKIPLPDGSEVNGVDVDFEVVREEWSEYRLKDGGSVRLRATALKISRIVDAQGKPTYQPDGQPALVVNNQVQLTASD
jgi:hypothetical protein